jgi:hypothetical protein
MADPKTPLTDEEIEQTKQTDFARAAQRREEMEKRRYIAEQEALKQPQNDYFPHAMPVTDVSSNSFPRRESFSRPVILTGKAGHIVESLHLGEPVFIFRAQDILSTFALDEYAKIVEKFSPLSPQLKSIVDMANEFRAWQRAHPELVKLPD